jgi:hypothetical protein
VLGGTLALVLWLLGRRIRRGGLVESLGAIGEFRLVYRFKDRLGSAEFADSLLVVSKGVAVVTVGAASFAYYAQGQGWFPDGVPIYGFGMMLFLAFILCTWLGGRRGEREGISKETTQDLAIWIFGGGLIGARLTFLFVERPTPKNSTDWW